MAKEPREEFSTGLQNLLEESSLVCSHSRLEFPLKTCFLVNRGKRKKFGWHWDFRSWWLRMEPSHHHLSLCLSALWLSECQFASEVPGTSGLLARSFRPRQNITKQQDDFGMTSSLRAKPCHITEDWLLKSTVFQQLTQTWAKVYGYVITKQQQAIGSWNVVDWFWLVARQPTVIVFHPLRLFQNHPILCRSKTNQDTFTRKRMWRYQITAKSTKSSQGGIGNYINLDQTSFEFINQKASAFSILTISKHF